MKKKLAGLFVVAALVIASVGTVTYAASKKDDNTRPGWGHGDTNHVHTGPPGQSVRPGNG